MIKRLWILIHNGGIIEGSFDEFGEVKIRLVESQASVKELRSDVTDCACLSSRVYSASEKNLKS